MRKSSKADATSLRPATRLVLGGREAVVIAGNKLLFAEEFGITCVEHREP